MVNHPVDPYAKPMLSPNDWKLTDVLSSLTWHEMGHMQAGPHFPGEAEAIVHVPYTYLGLAVGMNLDESFQRSGDSPADLRDAAIMWIITNEFQNGLPMNIESNPNHQIRYQQRGHAKYIDIAKYYGWDKLMAYFRASNLLYEAYDKYADQDISLEERKSNYYERKKWKWVSILKKVVLLNSIEKITKDNIAKLFETEATKDHQMASETIVNIVLMSYVTGTNLLSFMEFWGVNGIDADAKDKINILVGNLPTESLCLIYEEYESHIPQNQKDLTDHIQRLHSSYIKSIDPTTHVITWKESVKYLDQRYGTGWYSNNYLYDAEGMAKAQARISLLKEEHSCDVEKPTCKDSTIWKYNGVPEKNCPWVGLSPAKRCKLKWLGSTAQEECPVSCGETNVCNKPVCTNTWKPKKKRNDLKKCSSIKNKKKKKKYCKVIGKDDNTFAYEDCAKCGFCDSS